MVHDAPQTTSKVEEYVGVNGNRSEFDEEDPKVVEP